MAIPSSLRLLKNHPNAFNPSTRIRFSPPQAGRVHFGIYDIRGTLVITLVDGELDAGKRGADWFEIGARGKPAPSGVCTAMLSTTAGHRSVELTLAR